MPRAKVSNLPLSSYLLRVPEQSALAPTCGRWFHSTKDSLISNYKPSWTIRFWNNFQNPQKIELIVFPFFHSTQPFSPNPGPIIVCAIDAAIEQPLGPGISTLPNAGIFVKTAVCSSEKESCPIWRIFVKLNHVPFVYGYKKQRTSSSCLQTSQKKTWVNPKICEPSYPLQSSSTR